MSRRVEVDDNLVGDQVKFRLVRESCDLRKRIADQLRDYKALREAFPERFPKLTGRSGRYSPSPNGLYGDYCFGLRLRLTADTIFSAGRGVDGAWDDIGRSVHIEWGISIDFDLVSERARLDPRRVMEHVIGRARTLAECVVECAAVEFSQAIENYLESRHREQIPQEERSTLDMWEDKLRNVAQA